MIFLTQELTYQVKWSFIYEKILSDSRMKPSVKQGFKTSSEKQRKLKCSIVIVTTRMCSSRFFLTNRNITANMVVFSGEVHLWRVYLVLGHFQYTPLP